MRWGGLYLDQAGKGSWNGGSACRAGLGGQLVPTGFSAHPPQARLGLLSACEGRQERPAERDAGKGNGLTVNWDKG